MLLSGQRLNMAGYGLKAFRNRRYSAASGLVGIDYLTVMEYFKDPIVGFNQLRPYAEGICDCIRQTGGCLYKTSFHTVTDMNAFRCIFNGHDTTAFITVSMQSNSFCGPPNYNLSSGR
ncbi:MAG: hypothetical protein FP814_09875 [Desulfobacterium sp.]|nr:hypothetical protein [Desulfobacterium sp.]